MSEVRSFAATAMCSIALALASCSTPQTPAAQTAYAPSPEVAGLAADIPAPVAGPEVTVGTLTDPCTLGLDDPWWADHGGHVEFHRRCG
ncbi:MAG: hypothetical protein KGO48_09060 [Alphaproteobacteria bacterium]|nr:hypothetical protein [Alphaproteobacteria bacterium]